MKKDVFIFLEHIIENILDIEEFSTGLTKEELKNDKLKQNAIVRSLEIIGEAVKNVPNTFRNKHSQIEWSKISGLRDKLIHHYFGVDFNTIWDVIKVDLPELKKKIKLILKK